ncbi:DEAD/DEAH box helicase family protein [Shewanella sp. C32]|uniref:DEAD/DEAH box helicase family protein n=1 Tax=Shewanella electrica TaxID=515560 RepID=A0ABT2FIA4_9GAMM|nr:DEAD/DEAH box helicase family protein [Shewanella electrica]MCH1924161.1 DEAD/DEAH box helicase family protein [Shewanella electrica]MCS4556064.1 DEAD/DEAH box helicase family protein [Shewanella electrica]
MLRLWQAVCAADALRKFKAGGHHYFCQATPGAGKTTLAAEVALRLVQSDMIDLILCFSPSLIVADGIKRTFENKLNKAFTGGLGAIGQSLTYQALPTLNDEFWAALRHYRVFVVFDEIHHCSGDSHENANTWGQEILSKIQGLATYTLAMSGTPWRTDLLPIVMAQYTDPDGELVVDYQYTLQQTIRDRVCRSPHLVLVDNHHLSLSSFQNGPKSFRSIHEFLTETKSSYQSIIHNQSAIEHLLSLGCAKLAEIRETSSQAGGLVVAASVRHAHSIAKILVEKFSQSVAIATYLDEKPIEEIERFRSSNTQWIISVGMVSEGTDIPRLQVCCHLSSIKTELYFRQVLGRILRVNDASNQEAWLYTFAEASLVSFAEQIEQDIPDSCMFVRLESCIQNILPTNGEPKNIQPYGTVEPRRGIDVSVASHNSGISEALAKGFCQEELRLGEFKLRVISAFST